MNRSTKDTTIASTCPICCDKYTQHQRKPVECLHCGHICCRHCVAQYVLSVPSMPHCMSCRKKWDREFMYRSMTKTFILDTLKEHTERLMIEREKALLPMTQPIVQRMYKIEELQTNNYNIYSMLSTKRYEEREALYRLRSSRSDFLANGMRMKNSDIHMTEMVTDSDQSDDTRQQIRKAHAKMPLELQENIRKWATIRRELKKIQDKSIANDVIINRLHRKNTRRQNLLVQYNETGEMDPNYTSGSDSDTEMEGNNHTKQKRKKSSFIRACPQENCKGFLNHHWICGLCNVHICSKCHEVKLQEKDKQKDENTQHVCKPENIATAELLMKDTKGCPNCSVQIHKIDGCNMMFCTQCHTAFCWRTGEILKNERIHNPHYYEWLRQNSKDGTIPREPGDEIGGAGGCQERITMRHLRLKLQQCDLLSYDLEDILWNVHRIHIHIEMVEVPRLRNRDTDNTDLRIRYMMNQYNDTTWKHELYKRNKRIEKNTAIQQIYEMVYTVVREEFHKILSNTSLVFQNIIDCLTTLENVRLYANEQFLEVSKLYQAKVPKIEPNTWALTTQRADCSIRPRKKRENVSKEETIDT